ncbi:MAG: NAD(P)H-hydrate dehydratase [Bacteroidales bacterium]|nr:NAD(P)H-hydrate dehydratase [Bacteroidales bacterium]
MKILNASQIRAIDAYTIKHEPIASVDLMERAAGKCYEWIRRHFRKHKSVKIFCGMGNNGGDGLVIARMLAGTGFHVNVYKVLHSDQPSADFAVNEKRLRGLKNVHLEEIAGSSDFPVIEQHDLVIDAMLGSGLTRPLEGLLAALVLHINAAGAPVVAVDFPTGLFCEDNRGNDPRYIIRADYTLSFQFPKLAFMFASNERFLGKWFVIDIGLHPAAIREAETKHYFLQASDVAQLYRPRRKFAHKGHFGHAFLAAGSHGKAGAAVLAARAVVRSGAGLLTVQVPGEACQVIQTAVPEAMCIADGDPHIISGMGDLEKYNAIGIGPGIGTHEQTAGALKLLIQNTSVPMVLDADALNILAENPTWCGFLPKGSIFTPHPGEFDRIAGKTTDDHERFEKAVEIAHRFQVYVVLKGAHTLIACPDGRCFFNSTGNPGMATGGSGDVLTGMILAWLAQNYSPLHSCLLGVFLHGRAGDLAANRKGYEGLTAGDIIEMIPKAAKTTLGHL